MISKPSQDSNMIWHILGREKTLVAKFGRRHAGSRLKHVYPQINSFKKNELGLQFDHGHKNESVLLTNWFFFGLQVFFHVFKKLKWIKHRRQVFDHPRTLEMIFLTVCYPHVQHMMNKALCSAVYHSRVHFLTILSTDTCGFEDLLLFKRTSQG